MKVFTAFGLIFQAYEAILSKEEGVANPRKEDLLKLRDTLLLLLRAVENALATIHVSLYGSHEETAKIYQDGDDHLYNLWVAFEKSDYSRVAEAFHAALQTKHLPSIALQLKTTILNDTFYKVIQALWTSDGERSVIEILNFTYQYLPHHIDHQRLSTIVGSSTLANLVVGIARGYGIQGQQPAHARWFLAYMTPKLPLNTELFDGVDKEIVTKNGKIAPHQLQQIGWM